MKNFLAAFAFLMTLTAPVAAHAADVSDKVVNEVSNRSILKAGDYAWYGVTDNGPLEIDINLKTQMLYVLQNGALVGATNISSGREGFDSPVGTFTILGKEDNHWSRKYKADMPWTMWVTGDGVALHSGTTPGRKTSHGCIHLPHAFAETLYEVTMKGTKVTITNPSSIDRIQLSLR